MRSERCGFRMPRRGVVREDRRTAHNRRTAGKRRTARPYGSVDATGTRSTPCPGPGHGRLRGRARVRVVVGRGHPGQWCEWHGGREGHVGGEAEGEDPRRPYRCDLPTITVEPGGSTGWHTHCGQLIAVVKSGTLTRTLHDCSVEATSAGSSFIEPSGARHRHIGRNLGSEPVVLWVTYLLPRGQRALRRRRGAGLRHDVVARPRGIRRGVFARPVQRPGPAHRAGAMTVARGSK